MSLLPEACVIFMSVGNMCVCEDLFVCVCVFMFMHVYIYL